MIAKSNMEEISEFVATNKDADDFTLIINTSDKLTTRFAQNGITQHIAGENLNIRLEVAFDNKCGVATTNDSSQESLKDLIRKAENLAILNIPDPEFIKSESAHELPVVDNYSEETASLNSKTMVNEILKCVRNAKKLKAKVSGLSEKDIYKSFVSTANGFKGFYEATIFSHSMTMKKGGVETKVSKSVKDRTKFDMNKLIEQLNIQFNSLKDPVAIEYGRMPVILRPAAFLNWMYYLIWTFDRRDADEGTTPYTGQFGKQFFGKEFSFSSSLEDPELMAVPFFSRGIPSREIKWIDQGTIKNMKTSRYYAGKIGQRPADPYNIIVVGGDSTEEEMMKIAGRGVIINNFWYIRPVDRKKGEWTGLTRDGVIYFENGKIKNSVNNFRWNEIIHDATRRILALGKSVQQEYFSRVPTLLIDDFNFVDVTTF